MFKADGGLGLPMLMLPTYQRTMRTTASRVVAATPLVNISMDCGPVCRSLMAYFGWSRRYRNFMRGAFQHEGAPADQV